MLSCTLGKYPYCIEKHTGIRSWNVVILHCMPSCNTVFKVRCRKLPRSLKLQFSHIFAMSARTELFGQIMYAEEFGVPRQKAFVCLKSKVVRNHRFVPLSILLQYSILIYFDFRVWRVFFGRAFLVWVFYIRIQPRLDNCFWLELWPLCLW